jgi:hypothetical protein
MLANAFVLARPADAVEGGVELTMNGYKTSMMGFLPPEKGAYARNDVYSYFASTAVQVPQFNRVDLDLRATTIIDFAGMTFVTGLKVLGADWGFGAVVPFGYSHLKASLTTPIAIAKTDQSFTLADSVLAPIILGWHLGNVHLMGTWLVSLPTGAYNPSNISSLGQNHVAFDQGFNITWLEPKTHLELSAGLGYMVNLTNDATDYTSGNEFHSDFLIACHAPYGFLIGANGYIYQQVTGDTGSGALLGSYRGRVFGAGPIGGYTFTAGTHQYSFNLRYYREFGAENRFQGNGLYFTFDTKL